MSRYLLFLLIVLASTQAFAQSKTVIVYQDEDKEEQDKKKNKGDDFIPPRAYLKINPLLAFHLDIPIYLEYVVNDYMTVEGGVGVTASDPLRISLDDHQDKVSEYGIEHTSQIGYSARGNFKFFPDGRAPDGWYFGVQVRYQDYNFEVSEVGANETRANVPLYMLNLEGERFKRQYMDIDLLLGYNLFLSDRVVGDAYMGFGLRNSNKEWPAEVEEFVPLPSGNGGNFQPAAGIDSEQNTGVSFLLGFKIGFGL